MQPPSNINSAPSINPAAAVRFCDSCAASEVCVAFSEEFLPTCHRAEDEGDPTGCAGLCAIEEQVCHRLDDDAYRCSSLLVCHGPTGFDPGRILCG